LRIGRRLGLPSPLVTLGLSLWVCAGQSLVGGEWMLGLFEAKSFAYISFLFGLELVLAGRLTSGAALVGLGVTWHPAVGVVVGASLAVALLVVRGNLRGLTRPILVGVACALPGLVQLAWQTLGADPASADDWRFLAHSYAQSYLDPRTFPRTNLVAMLLGLVFSAAFTWQRWREPAWRLLGGLLLLPAVIFGAGMAAHAAGAYTWLSVTPFRFLPVFALLVASLQGVALLANLRTRPPSLTVAVLGALFLVALPGTPAFFKEAASANVKAWQTPPDDVALAFDWVAQNVAPGEVGIHPPWRGDAPWRTRHGQVVHLGFPRYDHLPEWRARVEALLGDLSRIEGRDHRRDVGVFWGEAKRRYAAIPPKQLRDAAARYGATYVVALGEQPLPLLHRVGEARVYSFR
jgi:hypothetical protein